MYKYVFTVINVFSYTCVSNYPPIVMSKRGAENLPSKHPKNHLHLSKFYNFVAPKNTGKLYQCVHLGEKTTAYTMLAM